MCIGLRRSGFGKRLTLPFPHTHPLIELIYVSCVGVEALFESAYQAEKNIGTTTLERDIIYVSYTDAALKKQYNVVVVHLTKDHKKNRKRVRLNYSEASVVAGEASGHGFLIASCIRTTQPLGPLTDPIKTQKSASTFTYMKST